MDLRDIAMLAIDETSFKRGHKYVTLIIGAAKQGVLDVEEGCVKFCVIRVLGSKAAPRRRFLESILPGAAGGMCVQMIIYVRPNLDALAPCFSPPRGTSSCICTKSSPASAGFSASKSIASDLRMV